MPVICPTVTAATPQEYRQQVARLEPFAKRIHIDLADGLLAPRKLIGVAQVYWPDNITADLHMMFKQPQEYLETLVSLSPNMVVVHAEAEGDIRGMILELQSVGIKAGVALLSETQPEDHADVVSAADHILIFAGNLGYQGGQAQMESIKKIPDIRMLNPTVELGWDGGISAENMPLLLKEGIEVFNVGGFIHESYDPAKAYEQLEKLAI